MISESMKGLHTRLLLVFLLSTLSLSTSNDSLTSNQPLADGETLVSAEGSFVLGFFSPNGSNDRYVGIWYGKVSAQTVVWVANRQRPITDSTGSMAITTNGSLIITAYNSTVIWSLAVTGVINPVAQLLDSGNFVVREASGGDTGEFAWQSVDYPTDTLLPGMKLGWNLTSGLDRRLTSWTSASDPSPGGYSAFIDIHGDPQLVLSQGSNWIWRAGPWNGLQFSGVPQMKTFHVFNYNFVHTQDEVYYIYYLVSNSTISRLTVDSGGTLQRMVWLAQANVWSSYWYWPKDVCDSVSPCGPNGVCSADASPTCSCLQGFEPKSPVEWALRDGSKGCVRRTALDCRNSTDGFAQESKLKLPDTSNATVDMSISLDECRTKCLSNCLCTGYASANVSGGESGCIIWTSQLTDIRVYTDHGQDLYVRLAAADLVITGTNVTDSNGSKSHKVRQVAVVLGAIFGALFLAFIGCLIRRNKRRKRGTLSYFEYYQADNTGDNNFELPIYDLRTILTATDDFSMENKLGEGGFGPVYKGKLDGREIAVKRLSETSFQGLEEFKNEVTLIAKLQHRNLVRLLGCCIHGQEKMLVYEYMPNKSLDVFLFDKSKRTSLDWQTRYRIIVGIVRGLLYLHEDSRLRIIHRDLKASNILLDGEMNPKISDFGMARIFSGDEKEANTRRVVGTYGYMSPEYAMDGKFSVKSDVFSFGVLVLEIISGVKNRGVYTHGPHENLLGHAWNLLMEGNALELVDRSMTGSYSEIEASRCIRVGLLCVQERPEDRPTMSSILQMLGSDDALPSRPKKPGFVSVRNSLETSSSASKQASSTTYDVTVTILDGR